MDRIDQDKRDADFSDVDEPDLMVMPDEDDDILLSDPHRPESHGDPQFSDNDPVHPDVQPDVQPARRDDPAPVMADPVSPHDEADDYNPYSPEIAGPGPYVDLDDEPDGSLRSEIVREPDQLDSQLEAQPVSEPEPEPEYSPQPHHTGPVAEPVFELTSEPEPEPDSFTTAPLNQPTDQSSNQAGIPLSSPAAIVTRSTSHDPVDLFSPYDEPSQSDLSALEGPFATDWDHDPVDKSSGHWLDRSLQLGLSVAAAMIIALFVQTFVFQLYKIPTTSMKPGLQVGDTIYASKFAYGINRHSFPIGLPIGDGRFLASLPERGDIAVFVPPHSPSERYVKRIIGLPGDRVRLEAGILSLNDQPVPRGFLSEETGITVAGQSVTYYRYEEILPDGTAYEIFDLGMTDMDDTASIVVPDGFVLVLGDNRDESRDSRVPFPSGPGLVPLNHLVGKAEFITFSAREGFSLFLPWTWHRIRPSRFFDGLDGGV